MPANPIDALAKFLPVAATLPEGGTVVIAADTMHRATVALDKLAVKMEACFRISKRTKYTVHFEGGGSLRAVSFKSPMIRAYKVIIDEYGEPYDPQR
jgi:hypothetical protein